MIHFKIFGGSCTQTPCLIRAKIST